MELPESPRLHPICVTCVDWTVLGHHRMYCPTLPLDGFRTGSRRSTTVLGHTPRGKEGPIEQDLGYDDISKNVGR